MCGIAGILNYGGEDLPSLIANMVQAIRYRGPDDSGSWCDHQAMVGLGHARLSILDLSPEGHQPMISASGRYVISYNGEVYNFAELRRELEENGAQFRGHSDTEVMLAAIEHWGLTDAVPKFVGMFAFALWDRSERTLYLVRDRLGIKPLYYGWAEQTFLFGSELKPFLAYKEFRPGIDRGALASFAQFGYVPAPRSIYCNVFKLLPGCWLRVPLQCRQKDFSPDPEDSQAGFKPMRYWNAKNVAESGCADPFLGSEEEALEQLDACLRNSVHLRMVADVPLGAFLSGGIDSSAIVALMQCQSARPVKTFTIGFHEHRYNEAQYARKVAEFLGTDHTELYMTPHEAMSVIDKLAQIYDEPFGDPSQIPTLLVAQLARHDVTVCLSGDGGDELFAGYDRYLLANEFRRGIKWIPGPLRSLLAKSILKIPAGHWTKLFERLPINSSGISNPGYKFHKLAKMLSMKNFDEMYVFFVSQGMDAASILVNNDQPLLSEISKKIELQDFTNRMMYFDLVSYLPDDILTKVDRASMAVSLEARVPLLDHRVVEFVWRLPLAMKIRKGRGKWLLRKLLYQHVPQDLMERPKMGFGVPIDSWLRGPLREWAEDLLNEERLKREGYFQSSGLRDRWEEHISGRRDCQYLLWNILMFQAWNK